MRLTIFALTAALLAQSPLYDYQRKLEERRRAYERALQEDVHSERPLAIAFRHGHPLAWVTVVDGPDEAKHCGLPTETIVFDLQSRELWKCTPDGARAPLLGDYAVILATGSVQLIDWRGGSKEERRLR